MRVEELKRGHWFVIAILLGAALAWVQGFWGSSATQTNAQSQFEMLLHRQPVKAADGAVYPHVTDIIIYPSREAGFTMTGQQGEYVPHKSIVRYRILTAAPERKGWYYKSAVSLVDDPYRPGGRRSPNATLTVQDYLKEVSANRDWIKFRYAWWAEPRWSYALWIGGSILVLGIAWPTVQSRLIAAGYGAPPEPKEKKDSLFKRLFSREKGRSSSGDDSLAKPKTSPMSLSQDDLDRLAKMEAELGDFAKTGVAPKEPGGEVEESPAPIKQLNTAPIEAPKPVETPREDQDYDGEFYPTVAHAKKKPDAKP